MPRKKRPARDYWCPCGALTRYVGYYECTAGCGRVEMGQLASQPPSTPVTSLDTPGPGRLGTSQKATTTPQEDPMPSHASKAAASAAADQAKRTASNGATLHAVPDPKPEPDTSKGDAARAAVIDELPAHQRAEYDRLMANGARHTTALGKARKLAEPAPVQSVDDAAAALFAAFAAGQDGAAAPPVTVAAATGGTDPEPDAPKPPKPVPVPQPKQQTPKQPRPKPAPKPAAPVSAADALSCQRHIGTVTLDGHVYDCAHAAKNGHMDATTAETCARRNVLPNYPAGLVGTRPHPVSRDRNGKRIAVPA